jgi:hypothetical protein
VKGHSDGNDLSRNDRSYSSCISQNQSANLVKRAFSVLTVNATPALTGAGPKIGRWLVGVIRGKAAGLPASMTPGTEGKDQTSVAEAAAASYDADEYNWSGFVCPYCSASSFVSCAGGHLACDGTIEIRKGGRFHQCFCGHAAFISGTMKTLESKRLSVEADRSSDAPRRAQHMQQTGKAADVVLPPPSKGLPAKG